MTRKKLDLDRHKRTLTALLIDIVKVLDGRVAFKGGTAATLFYNLPRFSLDLDFDVLGEVGEDDWARISTAVERHGQIKEHRRKRFTIFYLLDYERDTPNIKLEFNIRVWSNNSYQTKWLFGVPIKVADETTMLTNKLVALTERKSPVTRDVFDTYYFLKSGWQISSELIKERTGLSAREYLTSAVEFVEKTFDDKNILAGMGELLDDQQKEWARKNLRDEVIFQLKLRI